MAENYIYRAQVEELAELRAMYADTPQEVGELTSQVVDRLYQAIKKSVSQRDLRTLFESTEYLANTATFAKRVDAVTHPDVIAEGARTVRVEGVGNRRMIGPDQLRVLHDSRTVNLYPLSATDALRNLQIRAIGLSAVAPTIEALVAAGAEHIEGADPGILAPSNAPRNVGGAGLVRSTGKSKADALYRTLYSRNPYGVFVLREGKVVATEDERQCGGDITYEDMFADADLVIEVIDDPRRKAEIAEFAAEFFPQTLVMFVADLTKPIAGLSRPSQGNHFNQKISRELMQRMADPDIPINPLAKVVAMIGDHLPYEHGLDFLLFGFEKKYWSQLSSSARELSALATHLLIAHLAGMDVLGKNFTSDDVPRHLMGELNEEARLIYRRVMRKRFALK